jgi:hypothetical protein
MTFLVGVLKSASSIKMRIAGFQASTTTIGKVSAGYRYFDRTRRRLLSGRSVPSTVFGEKTGSIGRGFPEENIKTGSGYNVKLLSQEIRKNARGGRSHSNVGFSPRFSGGGCHG